MALCSRTKVKLPDKGIIIRGSGKHRYVYKVLSTFRNENGQPTNTRKAIGKLDEKGEMLIPNDTYWEFYGDIASVSDLVISDSAPSFDSVRSIGATFLIGRIFESLGVTNIIKNTFGNSRASLIMNICAYMVCRGNVFEYVADWSDEYTFKEPPLTSPVTSSLFASITYEERMAFFRAWASLQADNEHFVYDVTSFSSYATGIAETEWGYNRDKEKLPQINFGCYLGQKSGLPVFYVTYPGSIVDKSHLIYMMAYNETLGISKVCFIMDRGFCTTDNVKYMHASQLSYIMGVEIRHKAAREAVDEVRDDILSMRHLVKAGIYARTVYSRFYGSTSTMHIFFDPGMAECQRRDLYRTVEVEEEKLCQLEQLTKKEAKRYLNHFIIDLGKDGTFKYERNYEKIDEAAKDCGFFCLLSNTDTESSEVLDLFRRKDSIEKSFDDLKNHIDMKRLRTHSSNTTEGKMFCAFIALIAALEMAKKLSLYRKEKSMSKAALISELEKIKVVFMNNGRRLMNPITKTQRTILEYCGLSENDLKSYVNN
ncbi:MAG: transposase [Synergistaceae bacterium]|nr:transposase [Synergistaceae bacterium]